MFADRYELRGVLGQGGMGVVYDALAHGAHGFTRRVAVKQLAPEALSDPTFQRLFLDEARIASRLHHAGIVSVLDYGIVDGAPFQALELVEGIDARALLRRVTGKGERIPIDVALYITAEVAHALAYAHATKGDDGVSLGIVHRDVKPSNIFVAWSGDVKLADFGIALARDRISARTVGPGRGTPMYMPPEQLRGNDVDPRADIFALGCTLHVLAVGWTPLSRIDMASALSLEGELPLSDELPEDVRVIVARATQKDASQRYATARDMASALGEALAGRLRTDPKSRVLPWLDGLGFEREPAPLHGAAAKVIIAQAQRPAERNPMRMFETVEGLPTVTSRGGRDPAALKPRARRSRGTPFVAGLVGALGVGAIAVGVIVMLAPRRNHTPVDASYPVSPIGSETTLADASIEPPEEAPLLASASASSSSAPTTRKTVRRVVIDNLPDGAFGSAKALERTLAQRTLPCFRDQPYKPGVAVWVQIRLFKDGRKEWKDVGDTCMSSNGPCRWSWRPWTASGVTACVRGVVDATPMVLETPDPVELTIYFSPVW